jgi:hypothetical protein
MVGFRDVDAGADGGRQGFLDEERFAGTHFAGGLQHGAALDFGYAGGHAHHDLRFEEA